MHIYLDNAATTKPCLSAVNAVTNALTDIYGNPSSLHVLGVEAQKIIENSRKVIAHALGCDRETLYFTSGATESNNIALRGIANTYGRRKKRIVTTTVEHASVRETLDYLEQNGFETVRIPPPFSTESFLNAIDDNTCLVSMMYVNNETGHILPAEKVFTAVKRRCPEIITHCDCVQAFMKLPVKCNKLNADLISISSHKIYGVKGCGALYIRNGVRIAPIMTGGKQEKGIRSGTEAVPLIAGFGAAVSELLPNTDKNYRHATALKEQLLNGLNRINGITVNSTEDCSPYIVNISIDKIRSEIMLHFLEKQGVYVSSGSACSKGALSGVLEEFGVSRKNADCALRISFSSETITEDIETLVNAIDNGLKSLIKQR